MECLCKLMSTIGHLLDSGASKNILRMDAYFSRMAKVREAQSLESRHRFMIQARTLPALSTPASAVRLFPLPVGSGLLSTKAFATQLFKLRLKLLRGLSCVNNCAACDTGCHRPEGKAALAGAKEGRRPQED